MIKLGPVKDNSPIEELSDHPIVTSLANQDLSVLEEEKFLIFPEQVSGSVDLNSDNCIFTQRNGTTRTCNVVGVLSDGHDELRICSRFSKITEEDYFLRYMLQKILNYNVVNKKLGASSEMSYYDLLVFLFPYYLKKALSKGVYKEYINKEYDDSNIKGSIEIARHIRNNVPYLGKVAYRTREFSYDNKITELVRHTIEKIQLEYEFLLLNEDTKNSIRSIKSVTNDYSRFNRQRVIQQNISSPVKHSYFTEYSALQRLCIQILNEDKTGFGSDEYKIHGIIIDVAWIWEAYIWKVTGWKHYGKPSDLETLNFFDNLGSDGQQHRYPDFEFDGTPIDTKYKRHLDKRNDYNQLATYIHLMSSSKGGFIQPSQDENGCQKLGDIAGFGGELFSYKFKVPQEYVDYDDFVKQIKITEDELKALNFY